MLTGLVSRHNINREVGEHDFYLSLDEPLSMPYPVNVDTV
jgi:hypothetical protein